MAGGASAAGLVRIEQFVQASEADVLRRHGMGLMALSLRRAALATRSFAFAD